MRSLIATALPLAAVFTLLIGCPLPEGTPPDIEKSAWPIANGGLVPEVWFQFAENDSRFLTNLFIGLPTPDIESISVVMWAGEYREMRFSSLFTSNCAERLEVDYEFPSDITSVAVTLVAKHRNIGNPSTADGLYWAYLPNMTCTVDGIPQEEAEDEQGPLGYWSIPVNQPGQRSMQLAFLTKFASYMMVGDEFVDPGATAVDNVNGDISDRIIVSGSIDSRQPGICYLAYDVRDFSDNWALTVIRDVVVEPFPPRAIFWLTYDSVWPQSRVKARLYPGLEQVSLAFPGVSDWSQIRRIDVIRYYDTVPTPPWQVVEGKDTAEASWPLEFPLDPGRTATLRFNLVARKTDGTTSWGNPDYLQVFFNGTFVSKDSRSTWTCPL